LPLPGTGQAEWQGFIPYDQLPQALDPAAGYLVTANNDMTGQLSDGDPLDDPLYLQHFVASGYRQQRIVDRIEAQPMHDRASMQSIQADVVSLIGAQMTPRILAITASAAVAPDTGGAQVAAALAAWDFECPTGLSTTSSISANDPDPGRAAAAIGCMAFHALFPRLHQRAFNDELLAAGLPPERRARIDALPLLLDRPGALLRGAAYWDDVSTSGTETATTIVVAALNDAGAFLRDQLGADSNDWRWGRRHTLAMGAPFGAGFTIGPYANDGGLFTVDVANPRNLFGDDYSQRSGPSMRFACEASAADGVRCTMELPGGERAFTNSPYYDNLAQRWLVNDPIPLWIAPDDVMREAVETLIIAPPP
jgi:penicillin amidase